MYVYSCGRQPEGLAKKYNVDMSIYELESERAVKLKRLMYQMSPQAKMKILDTPIKSAELKKQGRRIFSTLETRISD